ncbi:mitochondrial glycoprotein [Parasitella parasitica]|nr:mitochondrial glycoprotein [Parasitella parasitica]
MSTSFKSLLPLLYTARLQPLARVAYKKAFIRPVIKKTFLQPTPVMASQRFFTAGTPRFSSGDVDPDLVHLLDEELQFEKAESKVPAFISEFLDTNLFQIEDKLGHDKVTLTRTFGNEKIKVIFSIADINNTVEEFTEEEVQDDAHVAPKDVADAANEKEGEKPEEEIAGIQGQESDNVSFPVRATVVIEKPDKGSLVLNTVAQDGYLHIDAVRYFKQGQMLQDTTSVDIGEQRQDLYMGPVYDELDEQIQITFTRYLEERGIDTALATFLPDYVDYKEQKEYVNWLKDVNDFVSA